MPVDSEIRFPGESEEYRRERNRLLEAEAGLRRMTEEVAAQRRSLPPGGVVPDDYVFEQAGDGTEVRFSQLFESGKDALVIYSFMFPRYSGDTRPGPAEGKTARLPLRETPCASCIAESPEGEQLPMLNVFVRDGDRFRHTWGTELMFAPRDEGIEARHVDAIWPLWSVLDLTPAGRGTASDFPAGHYE